MLNFFQNVHTRNSKHSSAQHTVLYVLVRVLLYKIIGASYLKIAASVLFLQPGGAGPGGDEYLLGEEEDKTEARIAACGPV